MLINLWLVKFCESNRQKIRKEKKKEKKENVPFKVVKIMQACEDGTRVYVTNQESKK